MNEQHKDEPPFRERSRQAIAMMDAALATRPAGHLTDQAILQAWHAMDLDDSRSVDQRVIHLVRMFAPGAAAYTPITRAYTDAPRMQECEHGTPYRYACDVCDRASFKQTGAA